jgi:hypothetical protein
MSLRATFEHSWCCLAGDAQICVTHKKRRWQFPPRRRAVVKFNSLFTRRVRRGDEQIDINDTQYDQSHFSLTIWYWSDKKQEKRLLIYPSDGAQRLCLAEGERLYLEATKNSAHFSQTLAAQGGPALRGSDVVNFYGWQGLKQSTDDWDLASSSWQHSEREPCASPVCPSNIYSVSQ